MANCLTMAQIQSIETLLKTGHSQRRVAELLGVHRETVAKYARQFQNQPNPHTGVELPAATRSSGPRSTCEPFRDQILDKLRQGLTVQRIYQDLVSEQGFTSSYHAVRRFVLQLLNKAELPVRRMETLPGEEAQVDFGTGAPVRTPDGQVRRPWVFRIVLSCSRKASSEAVWRQTTEAFITALENAFQHFGGVPRTLVIDNLKAAVQNADWYDPELHPKLQSFAAHYGTAFVPTRPYTPQHKGKVEAGIKYVKNNALKAQRFTSLAEENDFLRSWEQQVADRRIHGTTKQQVGTLFETLERPALLPLPIERFPFFHESRRTVHRDGHLEVDKAYYSVPPEYVTRRLWVRWDSRLVRVFNSRWEQVAVHAKGEPGRFRTASEHIPREKVSAVERGTDALLRQVRSIGPEAAQWAAAMLQARGVEGVRVLVGLKALAARHDTAALNRACRTALSHGAWRLRVLRALLKRDPGQSQSQFEFLDAHPVIRPLSDYSLQSLFEFRQERGP